MLCQRRRSATHGAFTAADKHWLKLACSHLGQALQYGRRLQESGFENALYANVLDRLNVASVLLDDDGCILRENPLATVLIIDATVSREPARALLRQLFGFTEAESALAVLLTRGLSIDDAAHALDVSRNTVNTHVKAMFVKCGVSRQVALVRLLVTSVAVLA